MLNLLLRTTKPLASLYTCRRDSISDNGSVGLGVSPVGIGSAGPKKGDGSQ